MASSAAAGTAIGQPVRATDADAGTTLVLQRWRARTRRRLTSDSTSGQLLTRSGVTLNRSSYTVEVVASDGTVSERITVTINVILNAAPQFSEGASATRTVASSEPAGTAIGDPVTATDADAGDTVNYSLEGADAASFAVNSASGQLLTRSDVTLDRSSYTVVVVASDGTASARITVTITVILNAAPEFASSSTSRFVVEQGSIGDNVGGAGYGDGRRPGRHADVHTGRRRRCVVQHSCRERADTDGGRAGRGDEGQLHGHGDGERRDDRQRPDHGEHCGD